MDSGPDSGGAQNGVPAEASRLHVDEQVLREALVGELHAEKAVMRSEINAIEEAIVETERVCRTLNRHAASRPDYLM
jgi:hypothetical protein